MTWKSDISKQLHQAFHNDNIAEFKRLLIENPDHIRHEDGGNFWMAKAASQNKLPIIQTLYELKVDVNESNDIGDETDPFYEPEGPILQAATFGHLDVVRWFLEHDAKINYRVKDQDRCLPLIRAATEGHLEVVKLLVEHGANVHATWNELNAAVQARMFNQMRVKDYLLSLPPAKASAQFRIGDQAAIVSMPPWVLHLPETSRAIFEYCAARIYPVSEFTKDGLCVLDVSQDIDQKFGGFKNDLRIEPEYLSKFVKIAR